MSRFVHWDPKTGFKNGLRTHFTTLEGAQEFLARPVAPEITELIEALTTYFGHIGMHAICSKCFAGEKLPGNGKGSDYPNAGHHGNYGRGPGIGCCAPCGLQGTTGCLSKPLGCALWMCDYTAARFPKARLLMRLLRTLLREFNVPDSFFDDIRPATLSTDQRRGTLLAVEMLRNARFA